VLIALANEPAHAEAEVVLERDFRDHRLEQDLVGHRIDALEHAQYPVKLCIVRDDEKGVVGIVSDNTHLQIGKDRLNFDHNNDSDTAKAKKHLETSGAKGKPGYDDCLEWLGYPNAKRK